MDAVRWTKKEKPTQQDLTRILKSEGKHPQLCSDKPGTKWGGHRHPFHDYVVIVSGQMKIWTDSFEWLLKPGDRLDIPANTVHWAEVTGKEEVQYLAEEK